jgi:arylformamidase
MSEAHATLAVEIAGRRWSVGANGHDISIPLRFDAAQPTFFGAAPASAQPLAAGSFVGDVRQGGSCNCSSHVLVPHCNGTHTECVGHITRDRLSVRELAVRHLSAALLISVAPVAATDIDGDSVVTHEVLQAAIGSHRLADYSALVVRTLPNDVSKLARNYDTDPPPPYFTIEAMRWIVQQGIDTLVVDLPSVDRAQDGGRLAAHRIFWGMPQGSTDAALARRPQATITEMAFVPERIADGPYLLNLQVPPFMIDAAPSRPILLPLTVI